MQDLNTGHPATHIAMEPLPGHSPFLAAARQRPLPVSADRPTETVHGTAVAGHGLVAEYPLTTDRTQAP